MKTQKLLSTHYLAPSDIEGAGRGVFAGGNFKTGQMIERCPVIELPASDVPLLKKTKLLNYYFIWGKDNKQVAIALGYGSLYNHSYEPNATYIKNLDENIIEFVTIKPIKKNEEITVNYNYGKPDDQTPLWIKDIKPPENS